jgi:hypothetical protein
VGPLHPLQPDRPQTHPRAPEFSAWEHSSFPGLWGIILSFPRLSPTRGQVIRVLLSRQPRSCTSRLAWLKRIPIAVPSGRINQNCYGNTCHKHRSSSFFGTWRLARFHRFIERRSQEVTVTGFLGSPRVLRTLEGNCSLPEFLGNSACSARLLGRTHLMTMGRLSLYRPLYLYFARISV